MSNPVVSYEPIVPHSFNYVLTIDGRRTNSSHRISKGDRKLLISVYASKDVYDYAGNLIRSELQSRQDVNTIAAWIKREYAEHDITTKCGWSTANQYCCQWDIKLTLNE